MNRRHRSPSLDAAAGIVHALILSIPLWIILILLYRYA